MRKEMVEIFSWLRRRKTNFMAAPLVLQFASYFELEKKKKKDERCVCVCVLPYSL